MQNVYPDEFLYLARQIRRRTTDDTIIKLQIATNPHLEPADAKVFAEKLMNERASLYDLADIEPELDMEALNALKNELQKSGSSIGVKVVE